MSAFGVPVARVFRPAETGLAAVAEHVRTATRETRCLVILRINRPVRRGDVCRLHRP